MVFPCIDTWKHKIKHIGAFQDSRMCYTFYKEVYMSKAKKEVEQKNYYKDIHFLYEILGSLKNVEEVKIFMKDILTRSELIMLKRRWHIANLLYQELDLRAIAQESQSSTQTVIRIKHILEEGHGGLILALERAADKIKEERQKYKDAHKPHGSSKYVKGWFK